ASGSSPTSSTPKRTWTGCSKRSATSCSSRGSALRESPVPPRRPGFGLLPDPVEVVTGAGSQRHRRQQTDDRPPPRLSRGLDEQGGPGRGGPCIEEGVVRGEALRAEAFGFDQQGKAPPDLDRPQGVVDRGPSRGEPGQDGEETIPPAGPSRREQDPAGEADPPERRRPSKPQ